MQGSRCWLVLALLLSCLSHVLFRNLIGLLNSVHLVLSFFSLIIYLPTLFFKTFTALLFFLFIYTCSPFCFAFRFSSILFSLSCALVSLLSLPLSFHRLISSSLFSSHLFLSFLLFSLSYPVLFHSYLSIFSFVPLLFLPLSSHLTSFPLSPFTLSSSFFSHPFPHARAESPPPPPLPRHRPLPRPFP